MSPTREELIIALIHVTDSLEVSMWGYAPESEIFVCQDCGIRAYRTDHKPECHIAKSLAESKALTDRISKAV